MKNETLALYLKKHPQADPVPLVRRFRPSISSMSMILALQVLDIARALEFLHQKDVVHGDISEKNVLISDDVRALVTDFGLSKLFTTSETSVGLKGWGTTQFQAPELLRCEVPKSKKTFSTDVYAFGILAAMVVTSSHLVTRGTLTRRL